MGDNTIPFALSLKPFDVFDLYRERMVVIVH
jgi:hypothetical protein